MKRIREIFRKVNSAGGTLYVKSTERIDEIDDNGIITTTQEEVLSNCPSCGRPLEQDEVAHVTANCPTCGTWCCSHCHKARVEYEKAMFEREIIILRDRLKWLESKAFDGVPLIRTIRKVSAISSLTKLEDMRRLLGERRRRGRLP